MSSKACRILRAMNQARNQHSSGGRCQQVLDGVPAHDTDDVRISWSCNSATLTANNMVRGDIVDGAAWRAGLRDDMKVIGRIGGEIGNAELLIEYGVMDGERKRTLSWLPADSRANASHETIRELVLTTAIAEVATNASACRQRLGGMSRRKFRTK